ncbi:O-antigen/teichoic acid export membrane protein [Actimicrobium sp. GrIS 1.19]|uniref:lipopolysaccharide biosynthesis protein n=1 Tax=Actimicrobium sp. GrIS 1.19 TaxID=3071708 RepID=UPI002E0083B5|nr:O-antigen/teichoic acid export membrane protein [Actimicrobium sp. GrIS 1.19]
MTSLSDRAGFLVVANLIKYAVGFIMPMVLVRMLSQADYGSYQQMILISTAAIGILTLGLPTSIYYFYHFSGPEKTAALVAQTTILLLVAGIFATLVVFFGADQFAATLNNPSMSGLLKLYAFCLVFMIGSEHCLHFMISQNRYGLAVTFEVVETVVRVLTLLAPLWLGFGFTGLIVGIVVFSALRFVVRNVYLFQRSGLDFHGWRKQSFSMEQLRYSTPIALVSLSGLLGNTVNRGMLASSFTPANYAVYAVGALEIPLDVIFQASVANVLRATLPALVRDGNLTEVVRLLRESMRKLSIIVLPSFIFLMGHSYQFITLLFTSAYAESVDVFRIYLWLMPLHMLVLSLVPQVFGKPKLNLYIVLAMTAVLLILGFVLLKTIGFYGPAIATVATQYVQTMVYFIVVPWLTKSSLMKLLPVGHMVRVVVAGLISLSASFLVDHLTHSGLLNLVLSGVLFSLVFFIVAIPLRLFSQDDIRLIKRWVAKILRIKLA